MARSFPVDVVRNHRDHLGEGPAWDARTGTLSWVDISGGRLHEWRPGDDRERTTEVGGELSAAVPRRDGGWVLARGHDLLLADAAGATETMATVETDRSDNRLNDCRCDPAGRLWAGTMSKSRRPRTAGLYRLDPDRRLTTVLDDTTLSNGLGWSPDGERMYFADSTTQRIDAFDYDLGRGTISGRRELVAIDPTAGLPDGLCVDSEGGVWVALFGGGAVRRYSPDGDLDAVVEFPVTNTTCPAFGGEDMGTLYVTTTRHLLSEPELEAQPLAGALFACRPEVTGISANPFAG
ncbi:MAG: SMP-30/gluconolactonase/LRE family protein [Actinobacteria bacterium]|nr:SMP-30/gluconolactonase/LRE family protein [Actinomycetota bacterium]